MLYLLFLQVPYELLNKKFRLVQKVLDREVSVLGGASSELASGVSKKTATVQEIQGLLDNVLQKVTSFKRKVHYTCTYVRLYTSTVVSRLSTHYWVSATPLFFSISAHAKYTGNHVCTSIIKNNIEIIWVTQFAGEFVVLYWYMYIQCTLPTYMYMYHTSASICSCHEH